MFTVPRGRRLDLVTIAPSRIHFGCYQLNIALGGACSHPFCRLLPDRPSIILKKRSKRLSYPWCLSPLPIQRQRRSAVLKVRGTYPSENRKRASCRLQWKTSGSEWQVLIGV
ncbi:hypothetical protein BaRGS_00014519, partial [Batillaria attramentaria]